MIFHLKYKFGILYGIDGDYSPIIADKIFMDKKLNYDIVAFFKCLWEQFVFRSKNDVDVRHNCKKIRGSFRTFRWWT